MCILKDVKVEDSAAFDWVFTGQHKLVAWGKKGFGGGLEVSCRSGRTWSQISGKSKPRPQE